MEEADPKWDLSKDKMRDAIPSTLFHISALPPFLSFLGGFPLSFSPPFIKVENPSWFRGRSPIPTQNFLCEIHSVFFSSCNTKTLIVNIYIDLEEIGKFQIGQF